MRCQPYFATKTAAIVPSTKRAIAPTLTITGSTVRRRVMRENSCGLIYETASKSRQKCCRVEDAFSVLARRDQSLDA
jgi:hypothetical protein